jgi:hypothetical protein
MYVFQSLPSEDSRIHKTEITFKIPDGKLTVDNLLVEFKAFLLACGFEFDGELVIQKMNPGPDVDV